MKPEESKWAIVDYCLNKFCPLLIIGFLVFTQFSAMDWIHYLIMGLILFIEKNNFGAKNTKVKLKNFLKIINLLKK